MALEQFSIDLEVELEDFLSSIMQARKGLNSLAEGAQKAADQISASFAEVDVSKTLDTQAIDAFTESIKEATNASNEFANQSSETSKEVESVGKSVSLLEGAGNVLGVFVTALKVFVSTAVAVAGTFVIFKTLNFLLKEFISTVATDGAANVSNFSKALLNASAGTARLAANIPGIPRELRKSLNSLDKASQGAGKLTAGFANLAQKNENLVASAGNVQQGLQRVDDTVRSLFARIPGGAELFDSIDQKLAKFGGTLDEKVIPGVGKAAAGVGGLKDTVSEATQGVSRFVPGLSKVTRGLTETGEVAGVAALGLNAVGVEAAFLSSTSGILIGTVLALNAAIIATGVAIASVGKRLVSFGIGLAEENAALRLFQKQLETTVKNAQEFGTSTDEAVGSLEDFTEGIEEIRKETGVFTGDITRVVTGLLQIQEQTGFTTSEILQLAENTVLLGKKFDDIPRAVAAVVGAFNNQAVAIRGIAGANTTVANTETKLAELLREGGDVRERLAGSTDNQRNALARLNIILESTANISEAVAESQDNLQIATRRLENAIKEARAEIGEFTGAALVPLTNVLTALFTAAAELPDEVQAVIGTFISLGGVVITVTGSLISFGGVIALVTTGIGALNGILGATTGAFSVVGPTVSAVASSLLKTQVVINSVGTAFGAVGTLIQQTVSNILVSITAFSTRIVSTDIALKSYTATTVASTAATATFGTTLALVGKSISLVTRGVITFNEGLLLLQGTFAGTIATFVVGISKFLFFNSVLIGLVAIFTSAALEIDFFSTIFQSLLDILFNGVSVSEALSNALDLVVNAFLLFGNTLKLGAIVVLGAFLNVLGFVSLAALKTAKTINLLSAGYLVSDEAVERLEKSTLTLAEGVEKAGTAATTTADKVQFYAGAADTAAGATANLADEAEKAVKELDALFEDVSPELLAEALNKVADVVNNTAEISIRAAQEVAQARILEVKSTIDSEEERAEVISKIESDLSVETLKIAKKQADDLLLINTDRLNAALTTLNKEAQENKRTVQSINEERRSIVAAAQQAEIDILNNLKAAAVSRLEVERTHQDERVSIIQEARDRIEGLEKSRSEFIFDNITSITDAEEKNARIREEIAAGIVEVEKARGEERFEDARKLGDRLLSLAKSLGTDPTVANAISAAVEIQGAETEAEFTKLLRIIRDGFEGDIPDSARKAFSEVTLALDGTDKSLDKAKSKLNDVKTALEEVGKVDIVTNQNEAVNQVTESLIGLEKTSISVAQKQADAFAASARSIVKEIAEIDKQITNLVEGIPPILINAEIKIDDAAFQEDILQIQSSTLVNIPARIQIKEADIEGGSIHSLTETPDVLAKILAPTDGIPVQVAVEGTKEGFDKIEELASIAGIKIGVQISQGVDTATQALRSLTQAQVTLPPINVDQVNVDGILAPIDRAAETVADAISPTVNGEVVEAGVQIGENVFIPGVGSFKVDGVASALAGTFNALGSKGSRVDVGISEKVNIPGIGEVSLNTANEVLLKAIQPTAPATVKVEVDQQSLATAQAQVSNFVQGGRAGGGAGPSTIGESNTNTNRSGARTIQVKFNFDPVVVGQEGLTFEQVGEKARQATSKGLNGLGPIQIPFNTRLDQLKTDLALNMERALKEAIRVAGRAGGVRKSFGAVFAEGALAARESFRKGLEKIEEDVAASQRRIRAAQEARNREPLKIRAFASIEDVGFVVGTGGGGRTPIENAPEVLNEKLNPGPIETDVDLDTKEATKTFDEFADSADTVDSELRVEVSRGVLNGVINQVQNQFDNNPISVALKADGVDIKGGSFHPFDEIGAVISRLIKPEPLELQAALAQNAAIPIVPGVAPVGGAGVLGFEGGGRPNQTVRVELAVNDKTFSVDTTDESSADSLVRFSKELELMKLTKGEAESPFGRGATF